MSTWNYRVIEFITPSPEGMPEGSWRAIHEVYYDENGRPNGYAESSAVIGWHTDEGDSAPFTILERMREALAKPVLIESDFHTEHVVINDLGSTQKSE